MAASMPSGGSGGGGEQSWAYELHLTPEWESSFLWEEANIYGDFSSLMDTLKSICDSFGSRYQYGSITYEFPEEFIFTVDGISISSATYSREESYVVGIEFGDNIMGHVAPGSIYLEKW